MSEPADAGFYLGREYDLAAQQLLDREVRYDPRDLTTHGVVLGMTGSGKTGLCVTLMEEAALAGVPAVIVDLKGDLTNLLLNFPELRPADFEPWVHPDEARRHDHSVADAVDETPATAAPEHVSTWADVPETVNDPKKLKALERELVKYLYDAAPGPVFFNAALGLLGEPGETEAAFRGRCRERGREVVAAELAALDARYAPEAERAKVQERWRKKGEEAREVRLAARKADIRVTQFGLAWVPDPAPGPAAAPAAAAEQAVS